MTLPQGLNQRWSLDFVSDALGCGRRFRILCVVDDFTRECLALVADTSLSGARAARKAPGGGERQRHGADLDLDPALVAVSTGGVALHRSREAHPERLR